MRKITIHRALTELKTIDDRINKAIAELLPVGIAQKDKLVDNKFIREEFESAAKEGLQSIDDMIARRDSLKSAIVMINAETMVKIGKDKMTIAEAINQKVVAIFRQELLNRLKGRHTEALTNMENANVKVEINALEFAKVGLSKDNVKLGDTDVLVITEPYLKANTYALVDPLKIAKEIAARQEKLDTFLDEVDATLSEVNATTHIEVS